MTESRAALILQAGCHQDFGLNPGCEVLYIQVGQLPEVFLFPFMLGIIETENVFQLFIGSGRCAAAVDTVKIRQERKHDRSLFYLREQCCRYQGQRAALRTAVNH